ncbi:MAG: ATP-binding protein [Massiliimalia sp.]|jgi:two-component system phosphate regulon sensor histidine kinase PhoR
MTKRIFRSILLASSVILIVGLAFVMGILYRQFGNQLQKELQNEASYLAVAVNKQGVEIFDDLSSIRSERITLVAPDGTVIYDNRADASTMDNHAQREEISKALQDGTGTSVRYSDTLSEKTVYYAVRLDDGSVLRISSTQYTVVSVILNLLPSFILIVVIMVLLSVLLASRASKKIVAPLNQMDLEHPEDNEPYDEITPLLSKISRQQKTIQAQLTDAKRQQEEFSLITEHMNEGILVIDNQTDLLSYNTSALHLLGASPKQGTQGSVLVLNRSEPFRKAVESALGGKHYDTWMELDNLFCQIIANPVYHDGKVQGAVLLLVDVTEKMQRESLRREFTANISHELKTPLTSISGFAEILQNGMVQEKDTKKFAGRIFDEAQRLITLVSDIIKISQLDEGCLPYTKEPVNINKVVEDCFHHLQPAAEKMQIELKLEGEEITLQTVKPILEEVIYNLCDNGIKYNQKGGSVTVSVKKNQTGTQIVVKDTGIGIPVADQMRVFERFYRVDKSHSKEIGGTGLGLSIVKHGAAYLGAEIKVESEVGKGTSFTLLFQNENA